MSRTYLFSLLCVAALATACAAPTDGDDGDDPNADDDSSTSSAISNFQTASTYERQDVYDQIKSSAHAPKDILSTTETDGRLVDALGWLLDQDPPAFYISAIRSDHHNDGAAAHAGGHALDMYAKNSADAKKLIQLLSKNPNVHEIGLGGAYKSYRSSVTKSYFNDNNATHVHIGVIHAFGK